MKQYHLFALKLFVTIMPSFISEVAKYTGIPGLALIGFVTIIGYLLKINIFTSLSRNQAFRIYNIILVMGFLLSAPVIYAWIWKDAHKEKSNINTDINTNFKISGTVIDQATNESLSQAKISVVGTNQTQTTESNGNFTIIMENTNPATARLRIEKDGYTPDDITVNLPRIGITIPLVKKK